MRLIDADDFKERITFFVCDAGGWLEPVTTSIKEYICKQVDAQTTVDAVEVVRCKDCECYDLKNYYCTYLDNSNGPDGFCNFGERKTDG